VLHVFLASGELWKPGSPAEEGLRPADGRHDVVQSCNFEKLIAVEGKLDISAPVRRVYLETGLSVKSRSLSPTCLIQELTAQAIFGDLAAR
jgi:hypothetical protein